MEEYVKIQKSGPMNLQCRKYYEGLGISPQEWNKLKSGGVITVPMALIKAHLLRGISIVTDSVIKERIVEKEGTIVETDPEVVDNEPKKRAYKSRKKDL